MLDKKIKIPFMTFRKGMWLQHDSSIQKYESLSKAAVHHPMQLNAVPMTSWPP